MLDRKSSESRGPLNTAMSGCNLPALHCLQVSELHHLPVGAATIPLPVAVAVVLRRRCRGRVVASPRPDKPTWTRAHFGHDLNQHVLTSLQNKAACSGDPRHSGQSPSQSAEMCSKSMNLGPCSAEHRRMLAKFGRETAKFGEFWAEAHQCWTEFDQVRPELGRNRQNVGQIITNDKKFESVHTTCCTIHLESMRQYGHAQSPTCGSPEDAGVQRSQRLSPPKSRGPGRAVLGQRPPITTVSVARRPTPGKRRDTSCEKSWCDGTCGRAHATSSVQGPRRPSQQVLRIHRTCRGGPGTRCTA